jgi:mannose-6-phosphate isomerase-like protein (cupin superfamily)
MHASLCEKESFGPSGQADASGGIQRNRIKGDKMIIKENEVEQFDFDGLKIKDYTATLNEHSSFATISVVPQISHKLSWSKRSDKYYYILAGKINFIINDKEYVLSNGDLCIIKNGEKFKYKNESHEIVKMILVHTPNFILDQEVFE